MSDFETTVSKPMISPNDMWSLTRGQDSTWGLEGYEAPRNYLDYRQSKWEKERAEILKKPQGKWPPSDWPKVKKEDGTMEVSKPKRPNYLDQVYKWSKSFYDEQKAKTIMEDLEAKGRPINAPKKAEVKDKKRDQFLENEKEKKKRQEEYSDYPKYDEKIQWIDKAKERIKEFEEKNKKEKIEIIKEKYAKFGSLPKCDRLLFVSDSEYQGEKIPFYNTYKKEGEDEAAQSEGEGKKKKQKKLFFPSKTSIWSKAPAWSYPKRKPVEKPKGEDAGEEGEDEEKKKVEPVDVRKSFYQTMNHGKIDFQYFKPYDYKTDQYKNWRQLNPGIQPGPQHYWKTLPYNKLQKNKKTGEEKAPEQVEGQPKIYLLNREKTDKRIYKPMRKHIF